MGKGIITGLDKLYWARMVKDEGGAVQYEAPARLEDVRSISVNPSNQTVSVDADDHVIEELSATAAAAVDIEWARQDSANMAMLLGDRVTDGIVASGGASVAPYGAVGYVRTMHDNTYRFVWLLKAKFSPTQESATTRQRDSITPQYPTLTGSAIQRAADGTMKIYKDSELDISSIWFTRSTLEALYNFGDALHGKPAEVVYTPSEPNEPMVGVIYIMTTDNSSWYYNGTEMVKIAPLD